MSGYTVKGRRKAKEGIYRGIRVGNRFIPGEVVITSMLAGIYLLFLMGSMMESGVDSLLLKIFSFVMFAVLAYAVRTSLRRMSIFAKTIDAFLILSVLPLIRDVASFLSIYDATKLTSATDLASWGIASTALSALLVTCIVYFEKDRLADIFIKAGKVSSGLRTGITGIAVCLSLFAIILCIFYNAALMDVSAALPVAAALLIYSIASACAEELWFRGLLLSRFLPVTGKDTAIVLQAIIFAIYQAAIFYTLTPDLLIVPAVLLGAAALGYYWGQVTIKNDSLIGSMLFHIGVDLLIALPAFAILIA